MNELLQWLMGASAGGDVDVSRLSSGAPVPASSRTRTARPPVDEEERILAEMAQQGNANFQQLPQQAPGVTQLPDIDIVGSEPTPAASPSPPPPAPPRGTPAPVDAMDLVRGPAGPGSTVVQRKPGIDPDKALLYAVLLRQVQSGLGSQHVSAFGVPQDQLQAALVSRLLSELNPSQPVNRAVPTAVVPLRGPRPTSAEPVPAAPPTPASRWPLFKPSVRVTGGYSTSR